MNLIVSGIVGGINEQNNIVNNVCADDWTAERAIIASNGVAAIFALPQYYCIFKIKDNIYKSKPWHSNIT